MHVNESLTVSFMLFILLFSEFAILVIVVAIFVFVKDDKDVY